MIEVVRKQDLVKTSYNEEDVIVLLKDLTGIMEEMSAEEREQAIQSGVHYSEMLPEESAPSKEYEKLYEKALRDNKYDIALGIARVAEMMWAQRVQHTDLQKNNQDKPIIVSLARAGIPVGILIKRYLKQRYNVECPHYAVSIIRDKGIDVNAMNLIYSREVVGNKNCVENIFFVDGWTGKGAIKTQLEEAVCDLKYPFRHEYNGDEDSTILGDKNIKWEGLSDELYVLADPANITKYCGTHKDFLLPSACLNSTVSGLTSRTILNYFIKVEEGDFHGAVYFDKFEHIDKSNEFIDTISNEFTNLDAVSCSTDDLEEGWNGMSIVKDICNLMDINDYKKVKPGIGETTRVLLRRIPWKVLINKDIPDTDPDIQHILMLCREKNVPIMRWDLGNYKVCGIIKELSADA